MQRIAIAPNYDRANVEVIREEASTGEGVTYGEVLYKSKYHAGAKRWCRDNLSVNETSGWARTSPDGYLAVTPWA